MSAKEISKLVRKITQARKIQRDRINSQQVSLQEEEANITKLQKPVVEEVSRQAKNTILALEQQQAQLAQINDNLVRNRQQRLQHQQMTPIASSASASPVAQHSSSDKWVQNFYRQYKLPINRVTKLEADLNGNIGEHGFIDMPVLFNDARLKMRLGGRDYKIKPEKVTKGLMALLLLHLDDMHEAKIQPTDEDQNIYREIMEKAGCKSSRNNKKFKAFLRDLDDDGSEDLTRLQEIKRQSPQKEEDEELTKTHGKGVFPYSHPEELRDRLDILFGSIRAGNNSKEVRSETRSLLDEMLEKQCIFPHIHEKFCAKFHL